LTYGKEERQARIYVLYRPIFNVPFEHLNPNSKTRVAVVTGSGRGIGKATAIEFAKMGYHVMMNDLEQEEQLKNTVEEISKVTGGINNKISYVIGDVSQESTSVSLIEETMKRFGRIDVLINNAAIAEKRLSQKESNTMPPTAASSYQSQASPYFTLEEFEVADIGLKGAYFCIREAVKRMTDLENKSEYENGRGEKAIRTSKSSNTYSIINISAPYESMSKRDAEAYTFSMSGVDPFTSSRAGIETLTKTVALQLADKGIRVNAIAPGLIDTDITNKHSLGKMESRRQKERQIPFHRSGQPEEIAKIAVFLASDDASYITGTLIYADGGLSLLHSNYFLASEIEED
jgi:glucose 1-dehydrogenase